MSGPTADAALIFFDRLPTWLLGLYGGPATPAFDRAAADGTVADFAFNPDGRPPAGVFAETHEHSGCPFDWSRLTVADPGSLNVVTPEDVWDGIRAAWSEDGVDVGEDVQPADVPDLLRDDPDLLSDDLRWDSDAASAFALLLMNHVVAETDRWLAETLEELAGRPFVLTARQGGLPMPRPGDTLLDADRHVPLIWGTAGEEDHGGRFGGLIDAGDLRRFTPQQTLTWANNDGSAVRTDEMLAIRPNGADRPRLFLKPDDRFCQLDVASQRPDLQAKLEEIDPTTPKDEAASREAR